MKSKGKVLIIDDNADVLAGLKIFLGPHLESIHTLRNPNLIHESLRKDDYDVILLDMNFTAGLNTGNEGIYWMHRILEVQPLASIVLITAYGDVELAVKAMKEGATDFIQKSWDEEKILSTVLSAISRGQSRREIQDLRQKQKHLNEKAAREYSFCEPESASMKKVFRTINKVAPTDANVLILGENGTGKEVIAREIHRQSSRVDEIFVSVNLNAIPESLFESDLFGHMKGAYTDAKETKPGRFELANKGSLFLDEIGNLPLALQTKLLTVLQERRITRLGSPTSTPIDMRLICATNMPLIQMVDEGNFRQDLLYRINTIVINIPPLRDRIDDIPSLASFYLLHFAAKYNKTVHSIKPDALEKLLAYSWPGNIRELQHAIEKAVILCESDSITAIDIGTNEPSGQFILTASFNLLENEKLLIRKALEKNNGNISLTARELGINRSTIYEKLRKYGIWPV
jgi:two-component system, NtrC family, response regulator HydG